MPRPVIRSSAIATALVALFVFSLTTAPSVVAQESLSQDVTAILDRAILRADPELLATVVSLAIEAAPANEEAILRYVKAKPPTIAIEEPDEEEQLPTGFVGLDGWAGEVTLGISNKTGNTDNFDIELNGRAVRDGERWRQTFRTRIEYATKSNLVTEQSLLVEHQTDYKFSERSYMFGQIKFRNERFSGYDYRLSGVLGYGYSVVKSEKVLWNLEAAPGYRLNRIQDVATTEGELIVQGTSNFTWEWTESTKLTNVTRLSFGSDSSTLENDTALTMRISARLSGRIGYLIEHETNPPAGSQNTSTTSKLSLVYGF